MPPQTSSTQQNTQSNTSASSASGSQPPCLLPSSRVTRATVPLPRFRRQYGPLGEPGVDLPPTCRILRKDDGGLPSKHFKYRVGRKKFHIKYGKFVPWTGVIAQVVAARGLAEMGSTAMVPKIYHAFEVEDTGVVYIVMEHIDGRTIQKILSDDECVPGLAAEAGRALLDLAHIPLPEGSRPSAVDGGMILDQFFDAEVIDGALRHYWDAGQLEAHINLYLSRCMCWRTREREERRLKGMSHEALALRQGDVSPSNFMKDKQGRLWLIDFRQVNILPASFISYSLKCSWIDRGLDRDDKCFAMFPVTENVLALQAARSHMRAWDIDDVFTGAGLQVPGADLETSQKISELPPPFVI
ncbi:hypothetical protein TWF696_000850 [Orbilia brochopaga]|uniref:Aminoglycoside phosphotransferase domain-containing protein n=1 Tax=Orbilia brochopaga TaxID=3140254 RepID=A0AAV9VD19_9PEZI